MASNPDLPQPVIRDATRQKLGLLTPDELSLTLEVSINTLQTWRCEGRGPRYIKLGKQVFYRFAELQDWVNEQKAELQPETLEVARLDGGPPAGDRRRSG